MDGWGTVYLFADSTKSDAAIKVSSPRNKDMPASPNNGCIDTDSFMVESREREGGRGLKRASEQLLSIKEAFSGDNVVEEFQKEKEELEAKEIEKDTPVVLPGILIFCILPVYCGILLLYTDLYTSILLVIFSIY